MLLIGLKRIYHVSLSLGVIGRLCSVVVALLGNFLTLWIIRLIGVHIAPNETLLSVC